MATRLGVGLGKRQFFLISGILAFLFNQRSSWLPESQRPLRNLLKNKLMTEKKEKSDPEVLGPISALQVVQYWGGGLASHHRPQTCMCP